jgi:hypothetical protein
MASFSPETYQKMFDLLLSQELACNAAFATEQNIKSAMKRILGQAIFSHQIKGYSSLVLDENLNVHFSLKDIDGDELEIMLFYGR